MKQQLTFLFFMLSLGAFAQTEKTVVERFDNGTIKSVRYATTDKNIPTNATEFFSKTLKTKPAEDFVVVWSTKAKNGMTFERYQQYYRGVKVEDGHYSFRYKDNRMKVANGHYIDVADINPVPSISKEEAIKCYASSLGLASGDIIEDYVDLIIKEIPKEQSRLQDTNPSLVYRICLDSHKGTEDFVGYVDAHTGNILHVENAVLHSSATGSFYTYYYRNNNDTPKYGKTEYENGRYILLDNTRGNGISTKKYEQNLEFEDSDNIWRREELDDYNIALDTHWTLERIYDWMDYFGHSSYDGNDGIIRAEISQGFDASYNLFTKKFLFGSAVDNDNFNPCASVDIIGHEFGHAIMHNTVGWGVNTWNFVRRALHEGFADVWGIIFETHISPSSDIWMLGEDITLSNSCVRNFREPLDSLAYYKIGSTYGYGQANTSDEHEAGGLIPRWFYLLSQGGQGTNEKGDSYTVLPVGVDLAEQLFEYAVLNPSYLDNCTTFPEVMSAISEAALDMEDNPFLAEQVQNAWYAVGLDIEPFHIHKKPYVIPDTYFVYLDSDFTLNWSFTNSGSGPSPTLVSNSLDHSCKVYASSPYSGTLNATITYGTLSVTYSTIISGAANTSSVIGDEPLELVPQDGSHYLISTRRDNVHNTALQEKQIFEKFIKVYNAKTLQLQLATKTEDEEPVLDTSSWKPGVYVVQITMGNETYSTKISVK